MGEVVILGMETRLDIPVERVLDSARDQLSGGVLIGWDKNDELYLASSYASRAEILYLLEKAKALILEDE